MMSFRAALRNVLPEIKSTIERGGAATVLPDSLLGDHDLIRRAMAALPNTSAIFPSRENFIEIAYALRAAFGPAAIDEARDAFQEWAGRWTDGDNDFEYTDAEFGRCKGPYRRGAAWLYELAERHGGGAFTRAALWFEPPAEGALFGSAEAATPTRQLTFMPFGQAADGALASSAKPLIKGLIDQGTMSVVYGDSNAGKTFVVLALAYHIATGHPWLGRSVASAKVAYVAAEGGRGIRKRFTAIKLRFGDVPRLYLLTAPIDLYDPKADLQPLIAAIDALGKDGEPVGLVVIDTLARAMAGGDENSARDMGLFVRHVDAMRTATGAHGLIVHHTGKDASRGARGSSVLRAATDTEIEIVKGGTLTATKQRDLDGDLSAGFNLETVELGRDETGQPVTSCVVRFHPNQDASTAVSKLKGTAADVFEAVEALVAGLCPAGASRSDVQAWLSENGLKKGRVPERGVAPR